MEVNKGKKMLSKQALIGTVLSMITLIIVVLLIVNTSSTINLNKYLTIEATGYDDYGIMKAIIDWEAMEEDYGDKIYFKDKAKEGYGIFLSFTTPIEVMKNCIKVEFSENENISNGDKVTYTWEIDEALTDYVKCKVKSKDGNYKVSDLKKVGRFDAFSDLKVSFDGIAPYGKISYEYSGEQLGYYDFSCSKAAGLNNEDIVTVSINNTDIDYYAQTYGMVPEKFEQEYVVSGLDEYVTSYSKIGKEYISKLKEEAEDTICAYAASKYDSTCTLSDLQYAGYVFHTIRDINGYYNSFNNLYVIYRGVVTNSEGTFNDATVYYPVRFINILSGNGGFTYDSNNGIEGYRFISNTGYGTLGYINPLECYTEIVRNNENGYITEVGDGFEEYAESKEILGLTDINDEYKELLYVDAINRIENYMEKKYYRGTKATNLKVMGEYLLIAKTQNTDFGNNNKYVVVCSATVSNSEGRFNPTTVYFPVEYDGVVKLPGDEYMYTAEIGILGNSMFQNSGMYTKGFLSGTEMYLKVVTANRDKYKHEVSEALKEFGE